MSRYKSCAKKKLTLQINRNMNETRMMRWEGYVARNGEARNAYKLLVVKQEGQRPVENSCEQNNELSGSKKNWDLFESRATIGYSRKSLFHGISPTTKYLSRSNDTINKL